MKLFRFAIISVLAGLVLGLCAGCVQQEPDNREQDYGYIQFKLYKSASAAKAVVDRLDYLRDANKLKVTLTYGETTISQTLILNAAGEEEAEFGLRSEKLKLLAGDYEVLLFELYDTNDELLYNGYDENPWISVVAGGLGVHDLFVDVIPRGKVKFTLTKSLQTKAAERQYTFDEIAKFDITVRHTEDFTRTTFTDLSGEFSVHFDDDENTYGYQTSTIVCDTLLSLPAGTYEVAQYRTFDKNGILLEENLSPEKSEFLVEDNEITIAKPKITLYEADEYIQDGYALKAIWEALDGPNWYGSGESDVKGSNWDFNKDVDLWTTQPGVQVHSNGRVARIAINDFGFRGAMPAAIGQLTELVELYLGTHNDNNGSISQNYDPSLDLSKSLADRKQNRMEYHKTYLNYIHPATQFSEPAAKGFELKGISIPAVSLYEEGYTASQLFDNSGKQREIRPMDMNYGKRTNGLTSLPAEIGNLTKLEVLYVANGLLAGFPEEFALLENLTDLEIYNCPELTRFPKEIAQLPKLVSVNISNNKQWTAEELYEGLDAIANGDAGSSIQILYCRQNNLEELPESFSKMGKMGLLDLAYNNISKLHPLGDVAPVQFYLDHNKITELPLGPDGKFCGTDDVETISIKNNLLEEFPDIFNSKSKYIISSVDLSNNRISRFPAGFKGINVETLTLAGNRLSVFPKELGETDSQVSYIILRANGLSEFPEGCFDGKYSSYMMSLDLTYNKLTELPKDINADTLPYLYGVDLSYNSFTEFPWNILNCSGLTILALRCQRDEDGGRCYREWPTGIYQHTGLRALYLGSNDIRKVSDTISYLIYNLDISDNPNITFDASEICAYWKAGAFNLMYDRDQNILGCEEMLM